MVSAVLARLVPMKASIEIASIPFSKVVAKFEFLLQTRVANFCAVRRMFRRDMPRIGSSSAGTTTACTDSDPERGQRPPAKERW